MSISRESVQQLLSSEDFGDRLRGVNQLRELERSQAFALVQPIITDSNTRVRYAAISQMDRLGQEDRQKALELLRDRLLNDPEADVQAAAADALAALKLTEAYEDLQALYHRTCEWLVQFSIIAALGELGDPRSFELLVEALNSDNNLIKTAAIGSLGELGDPRALPLLAPHVNDPDWQVRSRLVQALSRLGGEQAHQLLTQLVNDEVAQVAQDAQAALNASED